MVDESGIVPPGESFREGTDSIYTSTPTPTGTSRSGSGNNKYKASVADVHDEAFSTIKSENISHGGPWIEVRRGKHAVSPISRAREPSPSAQGDVTAPYAPVPRKPFTE